MKPPRPSSRPEGATPALPEWPEDVVGGKYLRILEKYVQALREEDSHGNQKLFLDDVFIVSLLAFHNPTLRSLRTIEDFSQTRQAQKHLSIRRICRSTLVDFHQFADSSRLEPILTGLRKELSRKEVASSGPPGDLQSLLKRTIAVDGTFLPALADVAWAVGSRNQSSQKSKFRARIDVQLNVHSFLPEMIVVPEPKESESTVASQIIQPGLLYVYDRGYSSFQLINAHYEADPTAESGWRDKAQFVIRYKPPGGNSPTLEDAVDQPLTQADQDAGIISDRLGYFRSSNPSRHAILPVLLREVTITTTENGQPSTLRLITNLTDIPATTIGLLYRQRWQIELFFRWLKSVSNFTHLISRTREGLLTNLYVTLIAVMLMYLHTGYRPSKYLFALLSGGVGIDELMPILRERERQCERERQSLARRRAKKNS
jgi:hypothetical protein